MLRRKSNRPIPAPQVDIDFSYSLRFPLETEFPGAVLTVGADERGAYLRVTKGKAFQGLPELPDYLIVEARNPFTVGVTERFRWRCAYSEFGLRHTFTDDSLRMVGMPVAHLDDFVFDTKGVDGAKIEKGIRLLAGDVDAVIRRAQVDGKLAIGKMLDINEIVESLGNISRAPLRPSPVRYITL